MQFQSSHLERARPEILGQGIQQGYGRLAIDLVLDRDVGPPPRRILRRQVSVEVLGNATA